MSTSARMLQLLSLLQTHRYWPGTELAARLEVAPRTLRRDIERLRDLGYAVDAVRGVAGGYQLRPGGSLPPLLLEDEEAVAIAVGLQNAAAGVVSGLEDTSLQALTKVVALMPPKLRHRMEALTTQTDPAPWGRGPRIEADVLTTLAQACRDQEPVSCTYTARDAEPTARRLEPHRLVTLGRRWYLVAWDRDREDWRSFRVDRIREVRTSGQRFRGRPLPAADALSFVREGIGRMPHRYAVRVRFAAPAASVAAVVGRWATVAPDGEGCVMDMPTDTLDWPLFVLANVDAPFTVETPDELRAAVGRVAARFAAAGGPPG